MYGNVQDTMRQFKDDRRVLMWELWNEPGRGFPEPVTGEVAAKLLRQAWVLAREVHVSQPLCSTAEGSAGEPPKVIARANSNVIL